MHPMNLPLHVLDAVERRWAAKLQAEVSSWKDRRMQRTPTRRAQDGKLELAKPGRPPATGTAVTR
jgi:hypothetical protein